MERPLSAKDVAVAVQRLNRSAGKRNATVRTPSDNTTPRTLILGLLDVASVNKSGVSVPPTKKSKLTKSPSLPPPQKRRKSMRQSLGDNATPRTIIQNFLIEASPETPLEAPQPAAQETSLTKSSSLPPPQKRRKSMRQSLGDNATPRTIIQNVLIEASPETPLEATQPATQETSLDGEEDTSQQTSPNSVEDTKTLPMNESNNKEAESPVKDQSSESQSNSTEDNMENVSQADTPDNSPQDIEPTTSQENAESLVSEVDSDIQLSADSSALMADKPDISTRVYGTHYNTTTESFGQQNKSKWKDLVTPQVPVTTKRVLCETNEFDHSNVSQTASRSKETVKKKPPRRTTVSQRKPVPSTTLPSSLIKSIFEHFSKRRATKETLKVIEKGSSLFFKQLSCDLMAYCQHAGRTTIDLGDVELLMKRQGLVTTKQSLNSLIEKYLPLEYRQELIPIAQSGNKILLKKST